MQVPDAYKINSISKDVRYSFSTEKSEAQDDYMMKAPRMRVENLKPKSFFTSLLPQSWIFMLPSDNFTNKRIFEHLWTNFYINSKEELLAYELEELVIHTYIGEYNFHSEEKLVVIDVANLKSKLGFSFFILESLVNNFDFRKQLVSLSMHCKIQQAKAFTDQWM